MSLQTQIKTNQSETQLFYLKEYDRILIIFTNTNNQTVLEIDTTRFNYRKDVLKSLLCLLFLAPLLLKAQSDTVHISLKEKFPNFDSLFIHTKPLVCTLKTDLRNFQKEKYNSKYQEAEFILNDGDVVISKNVRIKARGQMRKKICGFPPIRLNIQKISKEDKTEFGKTKVKMVVHCIYNNEYLSYLFKEYLTYKTYNIVSPYSFRVRLLKITYIDTGRKNKIINSWAFIIEPLEMLAERLNCVPIKLDNLGIHYTDSTATDLLSMWAYMIGNTDWSVVGQHNIKLIKHNDFNKPAPIPIPYDFDYCGLVNTDYAVPGDGIGINDVTERLFIGPCKDIKDYAIAAQKIINSKPELIKLIKDFNHLDNESRYEMINYLNTFFTAIERPQYIKYHIDTDCRSPGSYNE